MSEQAITIEFDLNNLPRYTDQRLALLWHVAQANPANGFEDQTAGDIAQKIGWEIIRRWLRSVPPEMYHHQQRHYFWHQLIKFAKYEPGGPADSPDFYKGTWVAKAPNDSTEGGEPR